MTRSRARGPWSVVVTLGSGPGGRGRSDAGLGHRLAGRVEARADLVQRALGVLLVLQRQTVVVPVPRQRLEQVGGAEVALAQHGERLGVLDVLEVDAVDPLAEDLDGADRVLAGAEEVAG